MTVYFITAISAYIFMISSRLTSPKGKYLSLLFALLSLITVWFISAIRYNVGSDFFSYYNYINNLDYIYKNINLYEYGMLITGKIVSYFTSNGQVFIAVTSLSILCLIFYTIKKKSSYPELSVLLFFGLGYFFTSLNIVTQYIAIGLVFFATIYILKGNKKVFTLLVLIASLFHISAIICLSFLFLHRMRESHFKIKILIVFGFVLIGLFYSTFLNIILIGEYAKYADTRYLNEGASFIFFGLYLMIAIVTHIFSKRLTNLNGNNQFYLLLTLVGVGIAFIGTKSLIIMRVAEYFTIFNVILLAELVRSFKSSNLRFVVYIWLIFITLLGIYMFLFQNLGHVLPYQTFIK